MVEQAASMAMRLQDMKIFLFMFTNFYDYGMSVHAGFGPVHAG
jgi:hypothetical protein